MKTEEVVDKQHMVTQHGEKINTWVLGAERKPRNRISKFLFNIIFKLGINVHMSTEFNQKKYDILKKSFEDTAKTIFNYENRALPSDIERRNSRINEYKTDLLGKYNNFIAYEVEQQSKFSEESKQNI